ncbi:hypothetical protein ESCAB7627_1725 [Escherichia albertii TW07627]|uniref:Uncharacterized protein n=1 Tax=Escherichia albertii (strain TW07627) TaxID=502347 RepID=A0ABC9NQM1_ESCAT|nr:hypothetical protein ESCAB7627_1725 [Escherichia albertii TW07627]
MSVGNAAHHQDSSKMGNNPDDVNYCELFVWNMFVVSR